MDEENPFAQAKCALLSGRQFMKALPLVENIVLARKVAPMKLNPSRG